MKIKKIMAFMAPLALSAALVASPVEKAFAATQDYADQQSYISELDYTAVVATSAVQPTFSNGFWVLNVSNEAQLLWSIQNKQDNIDAIQMQASITLQNPVKIPNDRIIVLWGNSNIGHVLNAPNGGFIVGDGSKLDLVSVNLQGGNGTGVLVNLGEVQLRTNTVIEGFNNSGVRIYNGNLILGSLNQASNYATIRNNTSENGGGVFVENGNLTLRGGSIVDNNANTHGNAIFSISSSTVLFDGTIYGSFDGGLVFLQDSNLTMHNGLIYGDSGNGSRAIIAINSIVTIFGGSTPSINTILD